MTVKSSGKFKPCRPWGLWLCHPPTVGLPRDLGWMSERLLHFYHVAIKEARRQDMYVILYDEGMYPSGACSARSSPPIRFQCRCLAKLDLADGKTVLSADGKPGRSGERKNGERMAVIDRKVG